MQHGLAHYGQDQAWNLIKEHGFLTKIYELNGQLLSSQSEATGIEKRIFSDYKGLTAKGAVKSVTTMELKKLCEHRDISSLFQAIGSIDGESYESRMRNMPDLNEPVNLVLHRGHKPEFSELNKIVRFDHTAVRQYIGVDIDKPEADLVNDFKQWLKSARDEFIDKSVNETVRELGGRTTKLKKAIRANSLDDLEQLKRDTLTYNIFPYIDVEIDIRLGGRHRNLQHIATESGLTAHTARKHTRPLIQGLMDESVLRKILMVSSYGVS